MNAYTFHSKAQVKTIWSGENVRLRAWLQNIWTQPCLLKNGHSTVLAPWTPSRNLLTHQARPGKTCWSETTYELVSGWLVCTVMRGKSWSRIGLLIFSLLTFCSRIILWAGCWPGHCRCLAASLQHDQISHLAKAFLRTAGPEFENRKQTERVPKKSPLPYSDYNVQIANFHEPISAMRMEFGIVSAPRMEFSVVASSVCWSLQCLISALIQRGWWWTLFFFF